MLTISIHSSCNRPTQLVHVSDREMRNRIGCEDREDPWKQICGICIMHGNERQPYPCTYAADAMPYTHHIRCYAIRTCPENQWLDHFLENRSHPMQDAHGLGGGRRDGENPTATYNGANIGCGQHQHQQQHQQQHHNKHAQHNVTLDDRLIMTPLIARTSTSHVLRTLISCCS